jgi:hypothetical protein
LFFFFYCIKIKEFQLTTESRTGKNILAVLKFDVTSVKSPLIIIINKITAPRGIPARNRSARATLNDNFETFKTKINLTNLFSVKI